tara:strand:+ start:2649 stop:3341 length:693 start_codon:yes stop_codon:yes gene_type:complete
MATLNEITYSTLEAVKGSGRYSDDNQITIPHIEFLAINNRAFLIRSDQAKGRSLSDNIIQTLPCVPVQQIDVSLCPCKVSTDCTIMRTVNPIPRPLELHQKDLITKVSGVDVMSRGWSIISFARASVAGISSMTKDSVKVFYHGGHIYIINAPVGLKYISIDIVAEDPRETAMIANCSGSPCYSSDSRFPISNYMLPVLKEMILKDLQIETAAKIDYKGDERNNSENQSS